MVADDRSNPKNWLGPYADGDTGWLALRAAENGIAIVPGAPFYPDGRGTTNVRLSFSNVGDELIDVGIDRLAALIHAS